LPIPWAAQKNGNKSGNKSGLPNRTRGVILRRQTIFLDIAAVNEATEHFL
jgi:hypothetical protein